MPGGASRPQRGKRRMKGALDAALTPELREAALQWFDAWEHVEDRPWSLRSVTIDGGTHAADSTRSYRDGMLWLFGRDE